MRVRPAAIVAPHFRLPLLAVLQLAALLPWAAAQGLDYDRDAVLGAGSAYDRLKNIYAGSRAFRTAYVSGAMSACKSQGSLCAAYGNSAEQKAELLMATSPQDFDARSGRLMGGFTAIGPPKEQGTCNTCVAFAVLAAAQSAVACALRQDATSKLSEQDFAFCKAVGPSEERTCSSSWSMHDGIEALASILSAGKYPVLETCLPYDPDSLDCSYQCSDTEPALKAGRFSYVQLDSVGEIQEQIRNWGSAVTRLDLYSDFKPFFESSANGIYPGHGPGAKFEQSHAIQLVGYSMSGPVQYWIAKNSWGTEFGSGGFFKIAFGKDGVGNPSDTFGIKWRPAAGLAKPYNRLSPSRARPGCYDYRAMPSDYVSRVAYTFDMPIQRLLLDNTGVVPEPDMMLPSVTLVLCGISSPPLSVIGSGDGGTAPPQQPQPQPQQQQQQPLQQQQQPQQLQQQQPQQTRQQQPRQQQQSQTQAQLPQQQLVQAAAQVTAPPQAPYALLMGRYTGKLDCDFGKDEPLTLTFFREGDKVHMEFVLDLKSWMATCYYDIVATCGPSSRGLCKPGEEAWACKYDEFKSWQKVCVVETKVSEHAELCYAAGAVTMLEHRPTCNNARGTFLLQPRRRYARRLRGASWG